MPPQDQNQIEQINQTQLTGSRLWLDVLKNNWWVIGLLIILVAVILGYILITVKPMDKDIIIKPSTDICSTYFGVCIENADGKWGRTIDTRQDFNLNNKEENISLAFIYTAEMEFKDADPGFMTASLLGQQKQVYKDTVNGLTRVLTGTAYDGVNLLIILASDKDITTGKVQEIMAKIKISNI